MYRLTFRAQTEQSHREAVKALSELEHAITRAERGYRRAEEQLNDFEARQESEGERLLREFPQPNSGRGG